ncbi:MAG: UMP kinase [Nanoarchaeota archaeon]|nr:UMP kinase [Nanoarchaeota archaeon]
MQKVWVISLGGSRIVPNEVDYNFLKEFKEMIERHKSKKFVVVTGGGSTARRYIKSLQKLGQKTKNQSLIGIYVTKLNASLMTKIIGKEANETIPDNMHEVKNLLRKNQIVFCGALRYKEKNTSDGTAANLAAYLKTSFINLTNVRGIFDKNPKTNKNAKFIKYISWKNFYETANKMKFKAGQHYVLDQNASKIIMEHKIPTYITGSLNDIENIISGKKFKGSLIFG